MPFMCKLMQIRESFFASFTNKLTKYQRDMKNIYVYFGSLYIIWEIWYNGRWCSGIYNFYYHLYDKLSTVNLLRMLNTEVINNKSTLLLYLFKLVLRKRFYITCRYILASLLRTLKIANRDDELLTGSYRTFGMA